MPRLSRIRTFRLNRVVRILHPWRVLAQGSHAQPLDFDCWRAGVSFLHMTGRQLALHIEMRRDLPGSWSLPDNGHGPGVRLKNKTVASA